MTAKLFQFPSVLLTQKRKKHIKLRIIDNATIKDWLKKQDASTRKAAAENGFDLQEALILPLYNKDGSIKEIIVRMPKNMHFYDMARVVDKLTQLFSIAFLKASSFEIAGLKGQNLETACVSWVLAAHSYSVYKTKAIPPAALLVPAGVEKSRVEAMAEAIMLTRNLINTPANDMGPAEIEAVAAKLATDNKATMKVTKGKALEKDFPLVHTVGKASDREPRLIDLQWGKEKNPKLTLVGKGVAFDTGGLDIKPSQHMALMKKDMGGAAHVLGLAKLIIALKLPVRLRVIIPAVENAIAGNAFRPGDVIKSRKGLYVENTNTDAEGRLILADALALACEEKPDLIIDFATLTGSARAALGPDIPALFATKDETGQALQKLSFKIEDPLWQMPLYKAYDKHIESSTANILNSAGIPGDLIYSALFLGKFVDDGQDWVHLDCYAWEQSGRPGRPKGGADTGLRSVFAYLQERYG